MENNYTLEKITVEKYKQIKNISLDLSEINILIGGNNSGKSSVLQALQFSVSCAQTIKTNDIKKSSEKRMDSGGNEIRDSSYSISIDQLLYIPTSDLYSLGYNQSLKERINSIEVEYIFNDNKKKKVIISKGRNTNINVKLSGSKEINIDLIDKPFSVYVPGLAGIARKEKLVSFGELKRAISQGDANLFFRNLIYYLDKNNELSILNKLVSSIFNNVLIEVIYEPDNDQYIIVNQEYNGRIFPIENAGTGLLQVAQILAYAVLFKPSLLLLDEPDSHIHPNNIKSLLFVIREYARNNNMKLIISTHSRHILSSANENDKVFWLSKGNLIDYDKNKAPELLMDMGALDDLASLSDYHAKYLIISEDKKTHYLEEIIKKNHKKPEFYGSKIFSTQGCENLASLSLIRDLLSPNKRDKTKILIILDRDYRTDEECLNLRDKFKHEKFFLIFTPGTDIEWSYCQKNHIISLYPEASNLLDQIFEEIKKELIGPKLMPNYHNGRLQCMYKHTDSKKINQGEISGESYEKLNSNEWIKYVKGKDILGILESKLKVKLKNQSIKLAQYSTSLNFEELINELKN